MIRSLLVDLQVKGINEIILEDGCLNYGAKIIDYDFSDYNKDKWYINYTKVNKKPPTWCELIEKEKQLKEEQQ